MHAPQTARVQHHLMVPSILYINIEVSPAAGQSSETKHTHSHETMSTSMFVCCLFCSTDWDSWESPRGKTWRIRSETQSAGSSGPHPQRLEAPSRGNRSDCTADLAPHAGLGTQQWFRGRPWERARQDKAGTTEVPLPNTLRATTRAQAPKPDRVAEQEMRT